MAISAPLFPLLLLLDQGQNLGPPDFHHQLIDRICPATSWKVKPLTQACPGAEGLSNVLISMFSLLPKAEAA